MDITYPFIGTPVLRNQGIEWMHDDGASCLFGFLKPKKSLNIPSVIN